MAVEYSMANQEIQDLAWDLIGQHHPDLGGSLDKGELVVVFREKASKSGGQVLLGSSRKAQPLMNTLAGERYKFIVELAKDQWVGLEGVIILKDGTAVTKQEALLDHLLCACRADHDEKTGKTKFLVAKPDLMAFRENVERYGMWFPKEDDDEDNTTDDVADMFGDDEEE